MSSLSSELIKSSSATVGPSFKKSLRPPLGKINYYPMEKIIPTTFVVLPAKHFRVCFLAFDNPDIFFLRSCSTQPTGSGVNNDDDDDTSGKSTSSEEEFDHMAELLDHEMHYDDDDGLDTLD